MLDAILKYQFMQNALISCVLACIICGIIGVIIVEKKLVMLSGGIAHTAYGGIGLGYLLGFEPMLGAIGFSIMAALGIGFVNRKKVLNSDVIIGMLWSFGMALGILFVGLSPGYPPNLDSYLFGNILSVNSTDIKMMLVLTLIVVISIFAFFQYWKSYLFDSEFAWINGINVKLLEYALLILIALSVVMLIHIAGIILIIALLTAPAAIAALITPKLEKRMLLAALIGMFCCFSGLWVSYTLNIPSGACIIIISVLLYTLVFLFKTKTSKKIKKQSK